MKYTITLLIFTSHLLFSSVIAREQLITERVNNAIEVFYPHLGNSMCRRKAFDIIFDKTTHEKKKFESWQKYEKICSKDGIYQLILSAMHLSCGYPNKSREILEQSIRNNINYDTKYHELQLYTTYKYLGEIEKASDLAKKMFVAYKSWYGGYQALGDYYLNVRDYFNAKKYLEISIKLHDKDPVTYLLLATVYYEFKEDQKVLDYYRKATLLDSLQSYFDWRSSAAAVGVYVLRGQFKEAKDILDHQEELFPEIKKDKRFNAVKEYYENALKKSNNSNTTPPSIPE